MQERKAFKPNALILQVYLFTALDPIESSSLCTQNWYHMMAPVTHSYIWNRYAAKTPFASLTKIDRQEIILSIEYSIIFIAVFVDKLQYQESCMHKCPVH